MGAGVVLLCRFDVESFVALYNNARHRTCKQSKRGITLGPIIIHIIIHIIEALLKYNSISLSNVAVILRHMYGKRHPRTETTLIS